MNLYPPLAPGPHHQPKQGAQKQPAPPPGTCTPPSRAHYAQYAPPTDAAYPGQHAGYASVGGQATGYGGWAGLEPQLQAQPPYAPTALWHQEQAPAGYGKGVFLVLSFRFEWTMVQMYHIVFRYSSCGSSKILKVTRSAFRVPILPMIRGLYGDYTGISSRSLGVRW